MVSSFCDCLSRGASAFCLILTVRDQSVAAESAFPQLLRRKKQGILVFSADGLLTGFLSGG